jgi:hypothetical protein
MTMPASTLHLSTEEVLYALKLEAPPALESALSAAVQRTGNSSSETRAWVRAAGHSLAARGLLRIDADGPVLQDPLAQAVRAIARARTSIAFRRPGNSEFYYFGPAGTFRQHLERDVVHTIEEVDGAASVVDGGLRVFDIDGPGTTTAEVEIPLQTFNAIRQAERSVVAEALAHTDVPNELREELADDLAAPVYRGDVVHGPYTEDGEPQPQRKLLVLGGAGRIWLVRESAERNGEPWVSIVRATPEHFSDAIAPLIQPAA